MILVSVSRAYSHITWVAYADGKVIGRETKQSSPDDKILSTIEYAEELEKAFRCIKGYLTNPPVHYDLEDKITVEVGNKQVFKWLYERKFGENYFKEAQSLQKLFDELSLPVDMVYNETYGKRYADKYNKYGLVKEKDLVVSKAVDWFSTFE